MAKKNEKIKKFKTGDWIVAGINSCIIIAMLIEQKETVDEHGNFHKIYTFYLKDNQLLTVRDDELCYAFSFTKSWYKHLKKRDQE